MYLHPKNGPVSFQKCLEMFCFHHIQVFTRCCFQNVSVRVPFSKSTVFKICRQKMCRFRVNGRPISRNFHRFQNVPASCERSLRVTLRLRLWYPGYLRVASMSRLLTSGGILSRTSKHRIRRDALSQSRGHVLENFLGALLLDKAMMPFSTLMLLVKIFHLPSFYGHVVKTGP